MNAAQVIERVHAKGQLDDPEWALGALERGLVQFMEVGKSSGLLSYVMNDGTAVIYAAAGELSELLGCLPNLGAWFRRAGAQRMVVHGRKGWQPFLERRGWRLQGDAMVKDLR